MEQTTRQKRLHHQKGVTYFSKSTERLVLFFMTMGMLIWGMVEFLREAI